MVVAAVDTEKILEGLVVPIPTPPAKVEVASVEVAIMALTVGVEVARKALVVEVPDDIKEFGGKRATPVPP